MTAVGGAIPPHVLPASQPQSAVENVTLELVISFGITSHQSSVHLFGPTSVGRLSAGDLVAAVNLAAHKWWAYLASLVSKMASGDFAIAGTYLDRPENITIRSHVSRNLSTDDPPRSCPLDLKCPFRTDQQTIRKESEPNLRCGGQRTRRYVEFLDTEPDFPTTAQ